MSNPNYAIYSQNYSLLSKLFNLSLLSITNLSSKNIYSSKVITLSLTETSSYYYLVTIVITSIDSSTIRTYEEFEIRIWENNLVEVVRYKKPENDGYENVYAIKEGVEIPIQEFQSIANNALTDALKSL